MKAPKKQRTLKKMLEKKRAINWFTFKQNRKNGWELDIKGKLQRSK